MMKCQHCGSTDIVAIQGQNYCLNCGYAVAEAAVSPPAPAAPVTAPKAFKKTPAPAKSKRKAVKKRVAPAVAASQPASLNVLAAPKASAPPVVRALDLHRPSRIAPKVAAHPLRFSLSVAGVLSVITGVIVGLVLGLQVDSDIGTYLLVTGLLILGAGSILAQGALFYGLSKSYDRRPAPHPYWWAAARGAFMEVVNVDIMALIGGLLIVVAGVAVWRLNMHETGLSQAIREAVLIVINLVLGWLLLGAYVARRVAVPAVIIGGITASEGLKVGWRLYRRAGGHLLIGGLEALLGRIVALLLLAVGAYALAAEVGSVPQPTVVIGSAVGAAIVVFVLVMVILEWESRVWLRQYRRWVASFGPAERVRLLTGRAQGRP